MNRRLLYIFFFGIVFTLGNSLSASAATLSVSPTSGSVTVGSNITVDIMLNTGGAVADAVDVYYLNFNPAIFQVVDASGSTAGTQISAGTLFNLTLLNSANNSTGAVQFSQVNTTPTPYSGTGKLATITFNAISAGTSPLTIDFSQGSTSDSNVGGGGADILTSVINGVYTVTSASTPSPSPSPSCPSPSPSPSPSPTPTPTPTPSPTPTPTSSSGGGSGSSSSSSTSPTPSPASSTSIAIGSNVKTTTILNVRATSSVTGVLLGAQATGATGAVLSGPISAGGITWWKINYATGVDGWSSSNYLLSATSTTPSEAPTTTTPTTSTKIFFTKPTYVNDKTTVKNLQTVFNKALGLTLKVDGIYGPATLAAVKAFQSKNGLTADGKIGDATRAKLNLVFP